MNQFRLKNLWRLSLLPTLCLTMMLSSCSDDEEGRISINDAAPAQVTNVTATSIAGGVTLTWNIPTSSSFMYTKVVYTDADGTEQYKMFSKERANDSGQMTATFRGFINTDPVKFMLYACSVRGNNAGAVEVSGTPDEPNFAKVVEKINVDGTYGGISVDCANEYNENVVVAVTWKSAGNALQAGSQKYTVKAKTNDARFLRMDVDGGIIMDEAVVTVHTEDEYGHASEERSFTVTPKAVKKLDQSVMSIPGYDGSSNAGTAGYSSQESSGEGAVNGRAICILDGDYGTFWHSAWTTSSDYPQWIIVDLGKDYPVTYLELTHRIGNSLGQKGHTIYTCSEDGAAGKPNSDDWAWVNHGTYDFDQSKDTPQASGFATPATTRYVKLYFGTEVKGGGNYVMLSEFNVFIPE